MQPSDIAGPPDLFWRHVRPRPVAVFVDGCQWHGCPLHWRPHRGPADGEKAHGISREGVAIQRSRDRRVREALMRAGYAVMGYWEHDVTMNAARVAREVQEALRR